MSIRWPQPRVRRLPWPIRWRRVTACRPEVAAAEAAAAVRERQVETLGESLTAAREAEAEEFIVENDVMAVLFSTRGGQIKGVTLKDYTQYGPRGKRDRKIEMMDPATARFGLSFYLKNGLKNVPVNTLDYVFTAQPVVGEADGAKSVVMRLPVAEGPIWSTVTLYMIRRLPSATTSSTSTCGW